MAIKRYITIASLALIAASCSQEEDFAPQHEAEGKPLTVASVSVGEMVVTRSVNTAVTTGTLGIYIDTDNSQQWTYDNSSWKLTGESTPIYYKNGMKAAMLHPAPTSTTFGEDKVTVTNYGVEKEQNTADNYAASDLKFSPYAELKSNVIAANLSHALAKVTVNISYGNTLGAVTTTPSVTLSGFKNNATLTIGSDFDVTMAESAAATDITMLKLSEANYTDAGQTERYDQSFEAIVIPQDVAANTLAVNITLGEKTYVATLTKDLSFSSGKKHIVNIQVGDNAILISEVTVEKWKTPENEELKDLVEIYVEDGFARITVGELATAEDIKNAIAEIHSAQPSLTEIEIAGELTSEQQAGLVLPENYTGVLALHAVDTPFASLLESFQTANNLWVLGSEGYAIKTDANGTANYYIVTSSDGLYAWNTAAQSNLALNLTLLADITLPLEVIGTSTPITISEDVPSGSNWNVIGTGDTPYTGKIEGNNYTIGNLTIKSESEYNGFIGSAENGSISNLTLKDCIIYNDATNANWIGGFAGYMFNGTITNCHLVGDSHIIGVDSYFIGGIVGRTYGTSSVKFCSNNALEVRGKGTIGGIVGEFDGDSEGVACMNLCAVTCDNDQYYGGIVGSTNLNTVLQGCITNQSKVTNDSYGQFNNCYHSMTEYGSAGIVVPHNGTSTSVTDAITAMNNTISSTGYKWVWNDGEQWPSLQPTTN